MPLIVRIDCKPLSIFVDDEAPLVVAGRVDQVADHFTRAPRARRRPPGRFLLLRPQEPAAPSSIAALRRAVIRAPSLTISSG